MEKKGVYVSLLLLYFHVKSQEDLPPVSTNEIIIEVFKDTVARKYAKHVK